MARRVGPLVARQATQTAAAVCGWRRRLRSELGAHRSVVARQRGVELQRQLFVAPIDDEVKLGARRGVHVFVARRRGAELQRRQVRAVSDEV